MISELSSCLSTKNKKNIYWIVFLYEYKFLFNGKK